jgi:site-specific DNA recombinase
VIALFDEYQSKENAKHVLRSMKENARQGFWNGSMAPLGYRVIEAEKRGSKIKKRLDIDAVEVETVKLIFTLYLNGDGESGALGVKEIVKWLNARGYRSRRDKTFGGLNMGEEWRGTAETGEPNKTRPKRIDIRGNCRGISSKENLNNTR